MDNTIIIEIRQQNETCQLHNVYVGYNKSPHRRLHSMALSLDEAKILAVNIIIGNKDYKAVILLDVF